MEQIKDTNFTSSGIIYTPILFPILYTKLQDKFCTIMHVYFSLIYMKFYLHALTWHKR